MLFDKTSLKNKVMKNNFTDPFNSKHATSSFKGQSIKDTFNRFQNAFDNIDRINGVIKSEFGKEMPELAFRVGEKILNK